MEHETGNGVDPPIEPVEALGTAGGFVHRGTLGGGVAGAGGGSRRPAAGRQRATYRGDRRRSGREATSPAGVDRALNRRAADERARS